jgi:hypothetical protein
VRNVCHKSNSVKINRGNYQIPSTNNQIMIKASMIKIQIPSPHPLPIGGEGKGEGRFGHLKIGQLEFIWSLGFGYWNLIDYGM